MPKSRPDDRFDDDPYPERPRILFIGHPSSTHTHSWVDNVSGSFNVRLFGLPTGYPPSNWPVRTYVTFIHLPEGLNPDTRRWLHPTPEDIRLQQTAHPSFVAPAASYQEWLVKIIEEWQPHVVHTFGLDPASFLLCAIKDSHDLPSSFTWVVQARGGPDLALNRLLSQYSLKITDVLRNCDQFIADNAQNYEYARELGLDQRKVSSLGVVPGTGGIDVDKLSSMWSGPTSKRERIILWPKAYEGPQSKALPVFEAIRLSWDRIAPCTILMTAAIQEEIYQWYQTLPEKIRKSCSLTDRIPRSEIFRVMVKSRVVLSPSLLDGIPNLLYEAMATGSFPIFSPLETIVDIVESEKNLLYARNLYPEEIAHALDRAMNDDPLVDAAALHNMNLVKERADRRLIVPKIISYYERISGRERDEEQARRCVREQLSSEGRPPATDVAPPCDQALSDDRQEAMLLCRAVEMKNGRALEVVDRVLELHDSKISGIFLKGMSLNDPQVLGLLDRALSLGNPQVFASLDRALGLNDRAVFGVLDRAVSLNDPRVFALFDRAVNLNDRRLFDSIDRAISLNDPRVYMLLDRAMSLNSPHVVDLLDRAIERHDADMFGLLDRATGVDSRVPCGLLDRAAALHDPGVLELLDKAIELNDADMFALLDRATVVNNSVLFGLLNRALVLPDARFHGLLKMAAALNDPWVFRLMTNKHGFFPAKVLVAFHVLMRRWGIGKGL